MSERENSPGDAIGMYDGKIDVGPPEEQAKRLAELNAEAERYANGVPDEDEGVPESVEEDDLSDLDDLDVLIESEPK